jgi:hypothetical protein
LFYLAADGKLMRSQTSRRETFEAGTPSKVFETTVQDFLEFRNS